jgi:hypothetical protein
MLRRWAPVVVLLGLLTGCESTTAGRGTPAAAPAPATSTPQGLPVPDDPAEPATTSAAPSTAPPTTTPPRTTPAGRPCPADVARTLPGSQPATLVAGFGTTRFRLYFCRTVDGQLYYRGISRADAKQATTLAAKTIPGGYEARTVVDGNVFVYRVAQRRLVVTQNGKQIVVDAITSTL